MCENFTGIIGFLVLGTVVSFLWNFLSSVFTLFIERFGEVMAKISRLLLDMVRLPAKSVKTNNFISNVLSEFYYNSYKLNMKFNNLYYNYSELNFLTDKLNLHRN